MKKMKLRKYVLPTIYVLIILVTFLSVSLINNHLLKNVTNYNYSKSIMKDVTENVLSEILPDKFERPYLSENVKLLSGFYSKDYDDESQKNSLIVYQNTYMPSSGTFYASQDDFDVVSVYDGKVKSIKKDEMLGDTVEVQHSDNLTTIYYSLKDVTVRENDDIKKGTIIGKATSNNLVTDKNVLFIEVYLKGKQIDPEKFYELNPNEVK
ncbi:MAG: M23 family metallopeptidase [Mycoplasma sp.]|jgi:cell wall endopeptidase, family M23/M37|nr:M23 family metallopeptidase [Mycoplasma sp.]